MMLLQKSLKILLKLLKIMAGKNDCVSRVYLPSSLVDTRIVGCNSPTFLICLDCGCGGPAYHRVQRVS